MTCRQKMSGDWAVPTLMLAMISLMGMACGTVRVLIEETDLYGKRMTGISMLSVITRLTAFSCIIVRGATPAPVAKAAALLSHHLPFNLV